MHYLAHAMKVFTTLAKNGNREQVKLLIETGVDVNFFGCVLKNRSGLGKLEPMKKMCGPTLGTALHVISYAILPIVIGAWLVNAGLNGTSLLDALRGI